MDVHTDKCWPVDDPSRVSHRRYFSEIGEAVADWGRYHGDNAKTGSAVQIVNVMAANHGGIDEIFVPTDNNNYVAVRFHSDSKVGVYVGESHISSIDAAPDDRFTADTDSNGYHRLYWPGYGPGSTGVGGSPESTRPLCACYMRVTADGSCTYGICDGAVA